MADENVDFGAAGTPGHGLPASPTTSVQFNNSGVFGGSAKMLWDGNILALSATDTTSTISLIAGVDAAHAALQIKNGANLTVGSNGIPATAINFGVVSALDGATPGAATVSLASVTANTRIFLSYGVKGGAQAPLCVASRSNGVSFTINGGTGDTSVVYWLAIEP